MDKLNKCYIWHIITLAKMKLRLRNLKLRNGLEMMRFGKNTDAATEIKLFFPSALWLHAQIALKCRNKQPLGEA